MKLSTIGETRIEAKTKIFIFHVDVRVHRLLSTIQIGTAQKMCALYAIVNDLQKSG